MRKKKWFTIRDKLCTSTIDFLYHRTCQVRGFWGSWLLVWVIYMYVDHVNTKCLLRSIVPKKKLKTTVPDFSLYSSCSRWNWLCCSISGVKWIKYVWVGLVFLVEKWISLLSFLLQSPCRYNIFYRIYL